MMESFPVKVKIEGVLFNDCNNTLDNFSVLNEIEIVEFDGEVVKVHKERIDIHNRNFHKFSESFFGQSFPTACQRS